MDMPDIKVKEDGLLLGDGTESMTHSMTHSMTQSILTQFHVSADGSDLSQLQLQFSDHSHMLPL